MLTFDESLRFYMTATNTAPAPTRCDFTVERGTLLTTSALARASDRTLRFVRRRIESGEIKPLYRLPSGTALFPESLVAVLRR